MTTHRVAAHVECTTLVRPCTATAQCSTHSKACLTLFAYCLSYNLHTYRQPHAAWPLVREPCKRQCVPANLRSKLSLWV